MRQEISQPQSRFSALTREQMAVCGNNKPDQRERERVRGQYKFSATARPPTQIACCHLKTVLIKKEKKKI